MEKVEVGGGGEKQAQIHSKKANTVSGISYVTVIFSKLHFHAKEGIKYVYQGAYFNFSNATFLSKCRCCALCFRDISCQICKESQCITNLFVVLSEIGTSLWRAATSGL